MLPKTPPSSWPWTHARAFAAARAVDLAPHEPALATWLDLLVGWNARLDLTAARGIEELVALMLADVIVLAGQIPRTQTEPLRVVDVGTGAGAPGLGLAILRPDLRVTLCEPLQKRAAFLRTVLGTLRRNDVTLTVSRGDALPANAFDVAISRATLAPPDWLALAETLLAKNALETAENAARPNEAWVLLARDEAPEVAGMVRADEHLYKWPVDGHERRAVRYVRV